MHLTRDETQVPKGCHFLAHQFRLCKLQVFAIGSLPSVAAAWLWKYLFSTSF